MEDGVGFPIISVSKPIIINRIAEDKLKNGDILWPGRVALCLSAASPDIFDIMSVLGQAETIRRLRTVVAKLKHSV